MSHPILSRILYVEDEPHIQAVAQIALEDVGGFTVTLASSGKECIERAKTFSPDLILLDVMMPGMDGPSTFRALKAIPETAGIPVIFLTAKVQPKEVESYKRLGALDVICKPFDPMTLSDEIRAIWEKSQQAPPESANEPVKAPANRP
jgi:two-component system OmpR family response regulator